MRLVLKHFFVPHHGNDYHPHFLHSKRALLYSLVFILLKMIVLTFIVFLPEEAFLAPDILNEQYVQIVKETNKLREEKGLSPLLVASKLDRSAVLKTTDMVEHQYFSHVGSNDKTLADLLREVRYDYLTAGENLAMGFNDAKSVVEAWKKSPTHYANLVDPQFKEIGLGIEGGYYQGAPTVYIAQHFGQPPSSQVKGTKIQDQNVLYKPESSKTYWLESPEGTVIQIKAELSGAIDVVNAQIGSYSFVLRRSGTSNFYVGTTIIPEEADYFFDPVLLPSITVIDTTQGVHRFSIDWYAPKISPPSTIEKYVYGKSVLGVVTPLFSTANYVFTGFIGLFVVALLSYVLLNVKRHNYRVIGQTMAVLMLLVALRFV